MEDQNKNGSQEELFEFGGIFDMKQEDFEDKDQGQKANADFYYPKLDLETVKNKTYTAQVRFVPNVFSGKERKDKIKKFIYYIPDPDNVGKKFYSDAPSNDPNGKDILTTAYMMLCYEKSKIYKQDVKQIIRNRCKSLKRNTYYYSLFLIMKDVQQPECEGTVRIMRFANGVNEKLEALIKGEPSVGRAGIIPYDPFKGKDFILKITEGVNSNGDPIASYEKSYFDEGIVSISLDGGKTRIEPNAVGKKEIYDFLVEKSPKLDQVEFKGLTPAEEDKIIRSVRMVIGDDEIFNEVYRQTYGKDYQPSTTQETITNAAQYAAEAEKNAPKVTAPTVMTGSDAKTIKSENPTPTVSNSTASKFRSLKSDAENKIQNDAPAPTVASQDAPTPATDPTVASQDAPAGGMRSAIEDLMSDENLEGLDDIR